MKRANLIVVVRRRSLAVHAPELPDYETGYTCQSVHMNFDGTVTFFSSGTPSTVQQEDIVRIEFAAHGAEFCAYCDQSIAQFSKA